MKKRIWRCLFADLSAGTFELKTRKTLPRKTEGAMITDEDFAIERCVRMVKEGKVRSITGKELEIRGDTLCVHGDGPKAFAFVEKIRKTFEEEGITIRNFQG